ncbi:MAG: tRNA epoxyqueuosine(34) reductase QueG [Flavobacteriales bacterium]|jgi:epoxyqueuosine reductase|nr:tRNA epoxyqueuosine(34) reductase QueG [Flavobacteriales bacterium]MBK6884915.1 tRNA epoxyqueuosine(34) reductase QueG [Flavobacteriales bacterium]MBK7112714.1 tRNA epoxyqueuosine(34) reductase QueG [Flavobacteriales bacterium]MBK7620556.1 tRNA epoxyqueuosine(34) reductase QueG [Flavobacteriales bacterium]MBK8531356.1 tRNA epoxyqueuosine(34) reductase QueG [Flavobacteriales bacterium]
MRTGRERSDLIKSKAHELGFLACGVARAEYLVEEAPRLERWLREGKHGEMGYMANHFDMRLDPRKLVPGAKSVISLAFNYYTESKQIDPEAPKLSTYAYGRDYHKVVKQRLKPLVAFIQEQFGQIEFRTFVDSAPVLEKAWAQRSGIGWVGKHTNVIRQGSGSFFFLCEIILDLELEPDAPATDHCGTCRRCIDACPTDAITPYGVDGSRCISYLTIELKDMIPQEFEGKMEGWAFGCDICQQVCPWNRFSTPHNEPEFTPKPELMGLSADEWYGMTEVVFDRLFEGSPVKRTKYEGLKRNVRFLRTDQ